MTPPRDVLSLDVYDIAYLAGGLPRLVDTAVVALVETGRVRVHSPGELATAGLVRRHPVEAAVLDAIGPSGHRSVDTVRWRVAADARVADVERRLREDRLLVRTVLLPRSTDRRRGTTHPSAAGRRVLRTLRTCPPVDAVTGSTGAVLVALGGRNRMPDRALCAAIFDQPRSSLTGAVRGRPPHELDFADGWVAARRTRADVIARSTDISAPYGG